MTYTEKEMMDKFAKLEMAAADAEAEVEKLKGQLKDTRALLHEALSCLLWTKRLLEDDHAEEQLQEWVDEIYADIAEIKMGG